MAPSNDDSPFRKELFYADLIQLADDDWDGVGQSLDNLSGLIMQKTYVKRTTSRINFSINGMNVGVAVYNMLGRARKPQKQRITVNTSELVRSERAWVHPDDGSPLLPTDMAKFMAYGGKNIKMSPAEVKHIQGFGTGDNFLRLIGFRDKSSLRISNHVKLPQFIYPCESLVKGSTDVLNALLTRCAARDKVAICAYRPRNSSAPSFVALVPQLELVEDNCQVSL